MSFFRVFILVFFISQVESTELTSAIGKIIQFDKITYFAPISENQVFILQKIPKILGAEVDYLYDTWVEYGSRIEAYWDTMVATTRSPYAKDAKNAIDVFLRCLTLMKDPNVDVWVAFSVSPEQLSVPATPENLLKYAEMSFAVITSKNAPVVQHFGIVRNPKYEGVKHSGMSVNLHAFAAAVMRQIDKTKRYMINIPLPYMQKIIQEALPEDATALGVNHEKSWITIDEDGNFFLKDYNKESTIFSLAPRGKEADNAWFYLIAVGSSFSPENYFTVRLDKLAEAFNVDIPSRSG